MVIGKAFKEGRGLVIELIVMLLIFWLRLNVTIWLLVLIALGVGWMLKLAASR